jgi:hypothetical protein
MASHPVMVKIGREAKDIVRDGFWIAGNYAIGGLVFSPFAFIHVLLTNSNTKHIWPILAVGAISAIVVMERRATKAGRNWLWKP